MRPGIALRGLLVSALEIAGTHAAQRDVSFCDATPAAKEIVMEDIWRGLSRLNDLTVGFALRMQKCG